jgi:Translation initiation factor IF-2, N-terminal region
MSRNKGNKQRSILDTNPVMFWFWVIFIICVAAAFRGSFEDFFRATHVLSGLLVVFCFVVLPVAALIATVYRKLAANQPSPEPSPVEQKSETKPKPEQPQPTLVVEPRVRINELSRELEVKAKAIIDLLPGFGVAEKMTHSSSITIEVAEKVRHRLKDGL